MRISAINYLPYPSYIIPVSCRNIPAFNTSYLFCYLNGKAAGDNVRCIATLVFSCFFLFYTILLTTLLYVVFFLSNLPLSMSFLRPSVVDWWFNARVVISF